MPGKDVFLSYASDDRERILPLVRALEGTGWTVFWDRTMLPGETWRQVIDENLKACRAMVVVWSKASVAREWVLGEADRGRKRKVLCPVVIDRDLEPPLGFDQIQATDLHDWGGSPSAPPFQLLVRGLSALLGEPPASRGADERVATLTPTRRWWWMGGVALVLAVAFLGVRILWRGAPSPGPAPSPTRAHPDVTRPSATPAPPTARDSRLRGFRVDVIWCDESGPRALALARDVRRSLDRRFEFARPGGVKKTTNDGNHPWASGYEIRVDPDGSETREGRILGTFLRQEFGDYSFSGWTAGEPTPGYLSVFVCPGAPSRADLAERERLF
ncbi:MAG TPA: toll/interleukin-1 receptor domain-containing protein [Vicinamibacteria bacterium]|nr:toll/interleukin-1 receptor domain-containing protein [Vicinamibacteria bacterium]